MNAKTQLEKYLGHDRVRDNFNLSPYLTLRTNTVAQYYFEAETREDLVRAKRSSLKLHMPIFILGGGSNLAILKPLIHGLVVRNKFIEKKIEPIAKNHVKLTVSSGYPVTKLAKELAKEGYEGIEYHFGLPGTVGGALYMNSKWTKPLSYFGDTLISANLLDQNGNVKTVDRSYFDFAYDQSILQKTKEIVLETIFKLKKVKPTITLEHIDFAMKYRKQTQPFGVYCSGCFFQNANGSSAGRFIDRAGLKGRRIGKFHVSEKHANFIVNDGDGNPEDLKKLLELIKQNVYDKFKVRLEEEVIVL